MNQAQYWHRHPALSSVQVNQAEMKFIQYEIHGTDVASGSTGIQDRSCKSASKEFLLLMHTAFSVASVFDIPPALAF